MTEDMARADDTSPAALTGRQRGVVMADVAAVAEVSEMTVSRVVNGGRRVHPSTRKRVLEAMDALGYRPNLAARSLATGRSGVIGVLIFDTCLFGHASNLDAIEEAAATAGYYVSIASLRGEPSERVIVEAIDRLGAQAVEGIVVVGASRVAAEVVDGLTTDVPIVMMEGVSGGRHAGVGVDQATGAAAAVRHLLCLGHETVVHIAGPAAAIAATGREQAWRDTLVAAGRAVPDPLSGDWSARSGYEAGQALARRDDVTAIFAANDQMAIGILRAMHEAGRSIPGDVSIVGFDDVPEAAYQTPPLTTVRQDFGELGRRGLGYLLALIDEPREAVRAPSFVEPELIVRRSCASPLSDATWPRRTEQRQDEHADHRG